MAALTTNSMGAITPYDSGPCSMTNWSDTFGSNITAFGVTKRTPLTTPCENKENDEIRAAWKLRTDHGRPVNCWASASTYLAVCYVLDVDFQKSFERTHLFGLGDGVARWMNSFWMSWFRKRTQNTCNVSRTQFQNEITSTLIDKISPYQQHTPCDTENWFDNLKWKHLQRILYHTQTKISTNNWKIETTSKDCQNQCFFRTFPDEIEYIYQSLKNQ